MRPLAINTTDDTPAIIPQYNSKRVVSAEKYSQVAFRKVISSSCLVPSYMVDSSITLVLAAAVPALGIGRAGGLPWALKREMKYFRQVTEGGVVVMGRRTWESIPSKFRPLKNRHNIVITRTQTDFGEGVDVASSLDEALELARPHPGRVYIVGGAQLYNEAVKHPRTQHILLTEIAADLDCDTFFKYDPSQWIKQSPEALKEFVGPKVELDDVSVAEDGYNYEFTLRNRQ